MIRLQRHLAACGIASRREAERLIDAGRVTVNGVPAVLGVNVNPKTDRVEVDGTPVEQERLVYLLLNKPRDVVTSAKDTHNRRTVLDCVAGAPCRVFPVGRLDMDVEGALLLTNDGELAYRLTHPRYEVQKVYLAWVRGDVLDDTATRLSVGITLDDGPTAPAKVEVLCVRNGASLLRLTLHEGRKREVKRMCAMAGHPVQCLQRTTFGGIDVTGLRVGEWRYLSSAEVAALRQAAGLT